MKLLLLHAANREGNISEYDHDGRTRNESKWIMEIWLCTMLLYCFILSALIVPPEEIEMIADLLKEEDIIDSEMNGLLDK